MAKSLPRKVKVGFRVAMAGQPFQICQVGARKYTQLENFDNFLNSILPRLKLQQAKWVRDQISCKRAAQASAGGKTQNTNWADNTGEWQNTDNTGQWQNTGEWRVFFPPCQVMQIIVLLFAALILFPLFST